MKDTETKDEAVTPGMVIEPSLSNTNPETHRAEILAEIERLQRKLRMVEAVHGQDIDSSVDCLIRHLMSGWAHAPTYHDRVYTDGHHYRVTVERIDEFYEKRRTRDAIDLIGEHNLKPNYRDNVYTNPGAFKEADDA